jgi:hypothetical protein
MDTRMVDQTHEMAGRTRTMKLFLIALAVVAANTAWADETYPDGIYFDRDGGDCTPLDKDGNEFYGYVSEGIVYFNQTRRGGTEGTLQDEATTDDGLIQLLVRDEIAIDWEEWYTLDPKRGYIAQGKLTDPKDVEEGHLLQIAMVPCG